MMHKVDCQQCHRSKVKFVDFLSLHHNSPGYFVTVKASIPYSLCTSGGLININVKVKGPYPSRGVGGVLISLSLAVEPVGG